LKEKSQPSVTRLALSISNPNTIFQRRESVTLHWVFVPTRHKSFALAFLIFVVEEGKVKLWLVDTRFIRMPLAITAGGIVQATTKSLLTQPNLITTKRTVSTALTL
jgi:hypothetical protein